MKLEELTTEEKDAILSRMFESGLVKASDLDAIKAGEPTPDIIGLTEVLHSNICRRRHGPLEGLCTFYTDKWDEGERCKWRNLSKWFSVIIQMEERNIPSFLDGISTIIGKLEGAYTSNIIFTLLLTYSSYIDIKRRITRAEPEEPLAFLLSQVETSSELPEQVSVLVDSSVSASSHQE